jgi:putative transposase
MPRKARIDARGALHHIIIRGIERRRIFIDDQASGIYPIKFDYRYSGVTAKKKTPVTAQS